MKSGKLIIGAVGLTCWRRDASRLLIALAQRTARQVTQGLLDDSSGREFRLLREYLRACRYTGGIVFALTHDMVLMNDQARDTLDPGDQAALLGRAAQARGGDHPPLSWMSSCRRGMAHVRSLVYLDSYVTALVHSGHGSCAAGTGGREPAGDAGYLDRRPGHRG